MQTTGELGMQGGMHGPLAVDPAPATEGIGDQQNGIMRLSARRGAGMARMLCAVVVYPQQRGAELLREDGCDPVGAVGHARRMRGVAAARNCLFAKSPIRRTYAEE